ncbi:MAG: hypothetical protein KTR16_10095 [Acidiferrobacterales bacterium]|nr:hypothetical protein [Acidiferrobacterales bacterium]
MLLLLISAFFTWMVFREVLNPTEKRDAFSISYIVVLASIAIACAMPAYKNWHLENFLSEQASIIAERSGVVVKCNSLFKTIFDGKGLDSLAGTAYFETGEIFFENGWCRSFRKYLSDPENASHDQIFAMHVFVHEVMHIRGERNEQRTDCQAIQRNHLVGMQLGVAADVAKRNALFYYNQLYPRHPYFNNECKPQGELDEKLTNAIWAR